MTDAVGNDAGFAGTGSGEDEEGALRVRDCVALLRVQACEEIHDKRANSNILARRSL